MTKEGWIKRNTWNKEQEAILEQRRVDNVFFQTC